MHKVLFVGVGGFIGASLRYLVSGAVERLALTALPLGTLGVNVIGSFCIGMVMEAGLTVWNIPPELRLLLVTGLLGGLTTFSTFSWETMSLASEGGFLLAGVNVIATVLLCLGGVWAGRTVIHLIGEIT